MKDPDDSRIRPHHRPHNAPLGPPVWPHIADIDQHPVPMHGIADQMRSDENVSREP